MKAKLLKKIRSKIYILYEPTFHEYYVFDWTHFFNRDGVIRITHDIEEAEELCRMRINTLIKTKYKHLLIRKLRRYEK